jgi:hypothetical protein
MRTKPLVAAAVSLAALAAPLGAQAWVVVRAPVYYAPRPVYVAPMPVVVAPAPVYVEPAPVYVAPPPPSAPAATQALPVNTTMWTLPSGCLTVSVNGQELFQCGPNYLKALPSDRGTYYAVVPPPQ